MQVRELVQHGHVHNIVVSPGPGTPANPQDVGVVVGIFAELADTPILGVCLGHQAMAVAYGGGVVPAPAPVHGRLSAVAHGGHALFSGIPSGGEAGFNVVRYHSLLADAQALPPCLQPICWTEGADAALQLSSDDESSRPAASSADAAGLLMGVAHRTRPHYGVQFHPESVATAHGAQLLRNFMALAAAHAPPARLPEPRSLPGWLHACAPSWQGASHGAAPPDSRAPHHLRLAHIQLDMDKGMPGGADVMAALGWAGGADTFWLDSSDSQRGRFSFLGGPGGPLWRRIEYRVGVTADTGGHQQGPEASRAAGPSEPSQHSDASASLDSYARQAAPANARDSRTGTVTIVTADGARVSEAGPLQDWLARFLAAHRLPEAGSHTQLPFDFHGGLVGYLGYELKAETGGNRAHRSRWAICFCVAMPWRLYIRLCISRTSA